MADEARGMREWILWVEDDIDTSRSIAEFLEERFEIKIFGSTGSKKQIMEAVEAAVSTERQAVVFWIMEGTLDLPGLQMLVKDFRPRAVVSDLELFGDSLGGFSVLSTAAEAYREVYLALFTGGAGESVERLARAMGIRRVLRKERREEDLMRLIFDVFPNLEPSKRVERGMVTEMEELQRANRRLKLERDRLQRQVASLERQVKKGKGPDVMREKAVRELREQLQEAKKERQMVLAQQHDLVNTSGLVTEALDALWSKPEVLPPVVRDELNKARIAAKHSSVLVSSVRAVVGGEKPKKQEKTSVGKAFGDALEIMTRKFPDSVSVSMKLGEDLPLCRIPESLLVRCAINLLLNSLHGITGRGRIEISSVPKATRKAKHVHIIIRDNGKGILKRDLPRVFDWDFSTKGKGHGMGLFIVKTVMDKYGGQVKIESTRGKGTTVRLKMPVA